MNSQSSVVMIKALNRAAIATAVRAALSEAGTDQTSLTFSLTEHLNRLAVTIEPTKTVSQDRYDLLELKYKTLLELLKYSEKIKQ